MAAGRHLRLRLAKPESRWLMVEKNRTPEPIESGEIEAFRQETEERTVVCFTLHKHLMEILRYLGAWGEVGLDADDKLSATMALYQLRILADESHEAADCLIQLPQTEFVIVLRTAITMILQNLDIAKTQADNVIADGSDDEAVIRYAREAVRESHAELAGPLKRMAAFLLTHELTADIRAKTQWIEEKLALSHTRAAEQPDKPAGHAATHSDDFHCVRWYGQEYVFSHQQAAVVKPLWDAWEKDTPDLGKDYLLEKAGSETSRLRNVFKEKDGMHPAWGTMIVESRQGVFRLSPPTHKS